jgi:hypothetical protein
MFSCLDDDANRSSVLTNTHSLCICRPFYDVVVLNRLNKKTQLRNAIFGARERAPFRTIWSAKNFSAGVSKKKFFLAFLFFLS